MLQRSLTGKNGAGTAQDCLVKAFPTIPSMLFGFIKLAGNPGAAMGQLADFIMTDAALLIRVIALVNSSPWSRDLARGSLRNAIALLGRECLRKVALTTPLLHASFGPLGMGFNLGTVWARSLFCARAGEALATELGHPHPEKTYLAGLLHDAGYLVFLRDQPEAMRAIFEKGAYDLDSLLEMERDALGTDHCQAGLEIARGLNLDPAIAAAIAEHHRPSQHSDWIVRITGVASAYCSYEGIDFISSRTLSRGGRTKEMEEIIRVLLQGLPPLAQPQCPSQLLAAMENATRSFRCSLGELFL
jgi:putative nucleotidyltransferase with HDIG domain